MPKRESPLTARGVELVRGGMSQVEAARLLGVSRSALLRACQRAGLALQRGRQKVTKPI